ncbi:MAG: hypothetical protein AABY22_07660 [Nanoarchaeota archaeon]
MGIIVSLAIILYLYTELDFQKHSNKNTECWITYYRELAYADIIKCRIGVDCIQKQAEYDKLNEEKYICIEKWLRN